MVVYRLSVRRKYLKLTTMYNIVSGHMHFPSSIFVQSNLPYHLNRTSTFNFIRPFAHTNYMYHSFVPSVISTWNNLPDSVKLCSCISSFKRSLLYHFEARFRLAISYTHAAFVFHDSAAGECHLHPGQHRHLTPFSWTFTVFYV